MKKLKKVTVVFLPLTALLFLGANAYAEESPPNYDTTSAMQRIEQIKQTNEKPCGNGYDFMDGGPGSDTVSYSGKRSEYSITKNDDHSYTVKDLVKCRADEDVVINVESFQFSDGTVDEKDLFSNKSDNKPAGDSPEAIAKKEIDALRAQKFGNKRKAKPKRHK